MPTRRVRIKHHTVASLAAALGESGSEVALEAALGLYALRAAARVSNADGDQVTARIICSSDGGANFDLLPVTLSGDVNHSRGTRVRPSYMWMKEVGYLQGKAVFKHPGSSVVQQARPHDHELQRPEGA